MTHQTFSTKADCEKAIADAGREGAFAVWVGPSAAYADQIPQGWYACCLHTRKYVL